MNKTRQPSSHPDLLIWYLVNQGGAFHPHALLMFSTHVHGRWPDHEQDREQRDRWPKEVRGGSSTVTHTYIHTFTRTGYHTGCVQTCSLKFPRLNLSPALSFLFHELPGKRDPLINNNQLSEAFIRTTTGCCGYLLCLANFWLKRGRVTLHWWIPVDGSDGFLVFK